jgi:PAS domain S-box-containing protein
MVEPLPRLAICIYAHRPITLWGKEMERSEIYTEKLMNMIMDAVDDLIIIHDSEHTIIWMNRSAEKAFGVRADNMIGRKCYSLFNHTSACEDCAVSSISLGAPKNTTSRRIIPQSKVECECTSIPYYEDGRLKLVVQKLTPVSKIVKIDG